MNIIIQYVQIKLSLPDPWGFIIVPIPIPHPYPWHGNPHTHGSPGNSARSPLAGAPNAGGLRKTRDFRPISRFITETVQNRAVLLWNNNGKSCAI